MIKFPIVVALVVYVCSVDAAKRCSNPPYIGICGECSTSPWPTTANGVRGMRRIELKEANKTVKAVQMFDPNDVVYYRSKDSRYVLSSPTSITCLSTGVWSKPQPKCEAWCNPLPTIVNAVCTGGETGKGVKQGKRATCSCNTGYVRASGSATPTCKLGNVWSTPLLVCKAVVQLGCYSGPPTLRNGKCVHATKVAGSNFTKGETASCKCKTGYGLSSAVQPVCNGEDVFLNVPTCTKGANVTCPNPPDVVGAGCEGCNDTRGRVIIAKPGDTVSYQCRPGYRMEGNPTVTCQISGLWTTPPQCISDTLPKCSGLPTISNGFCQVEAAENDDDDDEETNMYSVGKAATCLCNDGYQLNGADTIYCLSGRVWSTPLPTCTAVDPKTQCAVPGILSGTCYYPANSGQTAVSVGASVTCECDDGYKLNGVSSLTCSLDAATKLAKWSGTKPDCLMKPKCGQAPTITNGYCDHDKDDDYVSGEVVQCACNAGYAPTAASNLAITCQDTAKWTTLPVCSRATVDPKYCKAPATFANGQCGSTGATYNAGDQVACTCNSGYKLADATKTTVVCRGSDKWSTGPSCALNVPAPGNYLCPHPGYNYCICVDPTKYSCPKLGYANNTQANCNTACTAPRVKPCEGRYDGVNSACYCMAASASCFRPGPVQTSEANCAAYCGRYYTAKQAAPSVLPTWPLP